MTLESFRLAAVAPEIAAPFFFHWYFGLGLPEADTVRVTVAPATTV